MKGRSCVKTSKPGPVVVDGQFCYDLPLGRFVWRLGARQNEMRRALRDLQLPHCEKVHSITPSARLPTRSGLDLPVVCARNGATQVTSAHKRRDDSMTSHSTRG